MAVCTQPAACRLSVWGCASGSEAWAAVGPLSVSPPGSPPSPSRCAPAGSRREAWCIITRMARAWAGPPADTSSSAAGSGAGGAGGGVSSSRKLVGACGECLVEKQAREVGLPRDPGANWGCGRGWVECCCAGGTVRERQSRWPRRGRLVWRGVCIRAAPCAETSRLSRAAPQTRHVLRASSSKSFPLPVSPSLPVPARTRRPTATTTAATLPTPPTPPLPTMKMGAAACPCGSSKCSCSCKAVRLVG